MNSDIYELCEPVVEYAAKPIPILTANIASNYTISMNDMSFEDFIMSLTPARKKIALSAVGLFLKKSPKVRRLIRSSADIYGVLHADLGFLEHEECFCLMLNQASKMIKKVRISVGGITGAAVDVRLILREALLCRATSIVMAHNHPSGNLRPSRDDDEITKSLAKAAETMNIRLLDHLIITDGAYYSYNDEGRLP